MDKDKKLEVLSRIGRRFNDAGITWAVGASLLLYFNRKVSDFHDIDIMTAEEDVFRARDILLELGALQPPSPNPGYKTRHFLEFTVDGVDYDCAFGRENIAGFTEVGGVRIPLQSASDWRRYYQLMGRPEKAEMIGE